MRRSELPQHLRRRSFTTQSSDASGLTRGRTHASDLILVSRNIRMPAGSPIKGVQALAGYVEANPRSVLSHLSAARIWMIPLPPRLESDWRIHVANPPHSSAPRRVNVVGHRLAFAKSEIWILDGVRFTGAARTWLDLAASLSLRDIVAAGDFLVCQHGAEFPAPRTAICSVADLDHVVMVHPGIRGIRQARAALDLIPVGADSPPETYLRLDLVEAGLPEPKLNLVLRDKFGRALLWPDAAYPEYKLCLQYESHRKTSAVMHQLWFARSPPRCMPRGGSLSSRAELYLR